MYVVITRCGKRGAGFMTVIDEKSLNLNMAFMAFLEKLVCLEVLLQKSFPPQKRILRLQLISDHNQ